MGKCKRRTLNNKQIGEFEMFCSTRQEAVEYIIELLSKNTSSASKKAQKKQQNKKQISSVISLFGITAEELSEAGACYEELLGLGNLIE